MTELVKRASDIPYCSNRRNIKKKKPHFYGDWVEYLKEIQYRHLITDRCFLSAALKLFCGSYEHAIRAVKDDKYIE